MASWRHLRWLKQGVVAWNERRNKSLFLPDLQQADLQEANLKKADLKKAQLQRAKLQRAKLQRADLRRADLQGAKLWGADLREADLQGANLKRAELKEVDMKQADLKRADLKEVDLKGARLKGAKLQWAELQEADLQEADLQGADLQGANLWGADLREADLKGAKLLNANLWRADIRSLQSARSTEKTGRVDFTSAHNLMQSQINSMRGDTGVLLPDGLIHPEHWPVWSEDEDAPEAEDPREELLDDAAAVPQGDIEEPFVFLSYSSADRAEIAGLREKLLAEQISCFWDQDIPAGASWRATIETNLGDADIVLTVWTENSTKSDAVREEASTAQNDGKLVHARLDDAALPYGFAETQYQSLVGWDGDTSDPRWQKLIHVLKDRLFPPSRSELIHRLANAGSGSAIVEDGRVGITDTPPDGRPAEYDPTDENEIFEAIETLAKRFCDQWPKLTPNVSGVILDCVRECKHFAKTKCRAWRKWEDIAFTISTRLDEEIDSDWRGIDKLAVKLLERTAELKPYLKPIRRSGNGLQQPEISPEIKLGAASDDQIRKVSEAVSGLVEDPAIQEAATPEILDFLDARNDDLKAGLSRAGNLGEKTETARFKYWRWALKGLAGVAATAVTLLSGTTINLMTSPEAAKTFLLRMEQLLELLLKFF
ncbi:toll/interleukin-1 receptor domain-containing protein [Labrenzia sp. CE80]|uniref:toll/interleukin-1 receptor domain-containing protein n=1 Tax=Labrenzia sp. CE80 TaxID=1788986 RepID=UPI00129B7724|nr:toll/interleukin-1 receptor domain-containing protein [Labrenzia sp. CE80]